MSKQNVFQELTAIDKKLKAMNFEANSFIQKNFLDDAIQILCEGLNSYSAQEISSKATLASIMVPKEKASHLAEAISNELEQAKIKLELCRQAIGLQESLMNPRNSMVVSKEHIAQFNKLSYALIIEKPEQMKIAMNDISSGSQQYFDQCMQERQKLFDDAMRTLSQKIQTIQKKKERDPHRYTLVLQEAEFMKEDMDVAAKEFFNLEKTNINNFKDRLSQFKSTCATVFEERSQKGQFSKHRFMEPVTALVLNLLLSCIFGIWAIAASITHKEWRLGFFNTGHTKTETDMDEARAVLSKSIA